MDFSAFFLGGGVDLKKKCPNRRHICAKEEPTHICWVSLGRPKITSHRQRYS